MLLLTEMIPYQDTGVVVQITLLKYLSDVWLNGNYSWLIQSCLLTQKNFSEWSMTFLRLSYLQKELLPIYPMIEIINSKILICLKCINCLFSAPAYLWDV